MALTPEQVAARQKLGIPLAEDDLAHSAPPSAASAAGAMPIDPSWTGGVPVRTAPFSLTPAAAPAPPPQDRSLEGTIRQANAVPQGGPGPAPKPAAPAPAPGEGEFLDPSQQSVPSFTQPAGPNVLGGLGGHGGVIPAHNQPLVDPEKQKAYQAQFQNVIGSVEPEKEAVRQIGEATAQGYQAEARGIAGEQRVLGDSAAELRRQADERDAQSRQFMQYMSDYSNALKDQRFDAQRGWKNMSTGDQIATAVSALAYGWLQGRGKVKGNPALEKVQHINDQDLQAQYREFEAKEGRMKDMNNLYALAYRATGDRMEAYRLASAMGLESAKAEVERLAALSKDPLVRAQNQKLIADLTQRQEELALTKIQKDIDMNRWIPRQATGTQGTGRLVKDMKANDVVRLPDGRWVTIAEKDREGVLGKMHMAQEIRSASQTLKQLAAVPQDKRDKAWAVQYDAAKKVFTGPEVQEGKGGLGTYQTYAEPFNRAGNIVTKIASGFGASWTPAVEDDIQGAAQAADQINAAVQRKAYDAAASSATYEVEPALAMGHGKEGAGKVEHGYVIKVDARGNPVLFDPRSYPVLGQGPSTPNRPTAGPTVTPTPAAPKKTPY